MSKRNRVYPKTLTYDTASDENEDYYVFYRSDLKLFSHLKILGSVLKVFGNFPFTHETEKTSGRLLNLQSSSFWLVFSLIVFSFQLLNILCALSSYVFYDSAEWEGLVPVVWLLTPSIYFLQSLLYQILIFVYRKKIPLFYESMENLFKSLKIIPASRIKFYNLMSIFVVFLIPFSAYFSTCTIIKDASFRNSSLTTENCLVWYGYLYAEFTHDVGWFLAIFEQFLIFFIAVMGPIFFEQWLFSCTVSITELFKTHLQNLNGMMMDKDFIDPDSITIWINKLAEAHVLSEEFIIMTSPILLISVVTNPTLFCLQAFWIAKSFNYRMFKAWGAILFPAVVLVSSFIRFSTLGFSGQSFKDSVNALSKTMNAVSKREFNAEMKHQVDLVMYKEILAPVSLTACSFMSFTRSLLTAILGTTATYLIILVQMSTDKPCE